MIYSENPAKPVEFSSRTPPPLDASFMGQFEKPEGELSGWPDLSDPLLDDAVLRELLSFSSQYPNDQASPGITINQGNTNSIKTEDDSCFLQSTPSYSHIPRVDGDAQHPPGSAQAPSTLDDSHSLRHPANGTSMRNDTESEALDSLWVRLETSVPGLGDLDDPFGGIPLEQLNYWDPLSQTTAQLQEPYNSPTSGFLADVNISGRHSLLDPTNNSFAPNPQVFEDGFVNPAAIWFDPTNNGIAPYSQVFEVGFMNPAATCIDPGLSSEFGQIINTPRNVTPQVPGPMNNHVNLWDLNTSSTLLPPQRDVVSGPKSGSTCRRVRKPAFDPRRCYERLPEAPRSWKTQNNETFDYDECGSLRPGYKYSVNGILALIYRDYRQDPAAGEYGGSKLTLWIQNAPADSTGRYSHPESAKCRFADCPAPGGSIRKGFYRVAFDEQTGVGHATDPYHCAGFVHLFCLEKFCNFPAICRTANVQPDERRLPEPTNKMAITRDHVEMADVVARFKRCAQQPIHWDYELTLSSQLTRKHLELQPRVREATRLERGGNNLTVHQGDLDKFVEGEKQKREARQRNVKPKKDAKRKRDSAEEEDEMDSLGMPIPREMRPKKRKKASAS